MNGSTFDPAAAGVGSHTITYSFTDNNGCTGTNQVMVKVNDCSFLEENNAGNFEVYPNPTRGIITLKGIENLQEIKSINVLDNKGALIKKVKVNETQIDLSSFSTGIYFIEIKHQLGTGRIKVVKQ